MKTKIYFCGRFKLADQPLGHIMKTSDRDILLLYPGTGANIVNSPHAYLYVGASLKKHGFNPIILDQRVEARFQGKLREYLNQTRPLFAGLSSMTGFQIASALKIARAVRETAKDVPLVWGGVHPSLLPEQTVQHEYADIVIAGEGEQTAVELAAALREGRAPDDIPGVVTKSNAGKADSHHSRPFLDMDAIPPPDWSLIDVKKYITGYPSPGNIDLSTSRGCPHNCAFCYNSVYNRRRWRARGAESVLNEIDFLAGRYNIRHIGFADDNFCVNKKRTADICESLAGRKPGITFDCNVRADTLDEALAEQLAGAGCTLVYFGVESGSKRILEFVNKGIEPEQFLRAAQITRKHNIRPVFSFMIGTHPETRDDVRKSIALAKELKRINPRSLITDFKIYTPYPGTEMFNQSLEAGFVPPDTLEGWSSLTFSNLNLPWIKNRSYVLSVSFTSLFANYYDQIKDNKLNAVQKISMAVLHRTARLRWDHNFFAFPIEWKAVQFALNKLNL